MQNRNLIAVWGFKMRNIIGPGVDFALIPGARGLRTLLKRLSGPIESGARKRTVIASELMVALSADVVAHYRPSI